MKNSKIIKFILGHKTAVGLGLAVSIFGASPVEYKEQYDAKVIEVKALESNIEQIQSSTEITELQEEVNLLIAQSGELESGVQAKENELVAAKEAKAEAERIAKEEAERIAREEAERAAKAEADRIAREEAAKNQQASNNSSGGSSNGATEPTTTYVWKTATGSKYHSHNNCGNTNSANATKVTIQSAKSAGLTACKKCY